MAITLAVEKSDVTVRARSCNISETAQGRTKVTMTN